MQESSLKRRTCFIQGILNDTQYSRIIFSTSERERNSNGQLDMCPEVRCFLPIIVFRYPFFAWSCMIPRGISNKLKNILSGYFKNSGHKTTFMEHLHKLIYWGNPLTRFPRIPAGIHKKDHSRQALVSIDRFSSLEEWGRRDHAVKDYGRLLSFNLLFPRWPFSWPLDRCDSSDIAPEDLPGGGDGCDGDGRAVNWRIAPVTW